MSDTSENSVRVLPYRFLGFHVWHIWKFCKGTPLHIFKISCLTHLEILYSSVNPLQFFRISCLPHNNSCLDFCIWISCLIQWFCKGTPLSRFLGFHFSWFCIWKSTYVQIFECRIQQCIIQWRTMLFDEEEKILIDMWLFIPCVHLSIYLSFISIYLSIYLHTHKLFIYFSRFLILS